MGHKFVCWLYVIRMIWVDLNVHEKGGEKNVSFISFGFRKNWLYLLTSVFHFLSIENKKN